MRFAPLEPTSLAIVLARDRRRIGRRNGGPLSHTRRTRRPRRSRQEPLPSRSWSPRCWRPAARCASTTARQPTSGGATRVCSSPSRPTTTRSPSSAGSATAARRPRRRPGRRRSPSRTTPARSSARPPATPDGIFDIDLPGTPIDVLGKHLHGQARRSDPARGHRARRARPAPSTINLDTDQSVTFPIGEAGPRRRRQGHPGAPAAVGGLVFSLLLAMAALGLSMIFGTTGLTNFAHGELITFGALVAFAVDQLPGHDHASAAPTSPSSSRVIVAFIASGGRSAGSTTRALWRPLRHRGTGLIAMMIVSIGLSIFLRNIFQYFAGAQSQQLLPVLRGRSRGRSARSCSRPRSVVGLRRSAMLVAGRRPRPAAVHPARQGHPRGRRQPGARRRHRHQRRPGHLGRLDRRRRARRPVRRAARA